MRVRDPWFEMSTFVLGMFFMAAAVSAVARALTRGDSVLIAANLFAIFALVGGFFLFTSRRLGEMQRRLRENRSARTTGTPITK